MNVPHLYVSLSLSALFLQTAVLSLTLTICVYTITVLTNESHTGNNKSYISLAQSPLSVAFTFEPSVLYS